MQRRHTHERRLLIHSMSNARRSNKRTERHDDQSSSSLNSFPPFSTSFSLACRLSGFFKQCIYFSCLLLQALPPFSTSSFSPTTLVGSSIVIDGRNFIRALIV
ncbi:hypothetical protein FA10DRAFT_179180 [Acaromyces ingoldii]|uniref:Uncharacterized protein n=1 Tax=Acaromyces ingoldii TaxID=215250 RepID=A0A316YGA1_9BASI|nr:hypothetical protein FA10DRAFT_179180 [Acaromyces ingoldii]PWN87874.1 hypothetical protein FA10DRAFT_179180 [Acaromyces ingoldii]